MSLRIVKLFNFAFLLFIIQSSNALPEDRNQTILFSAGSVDFNQKDHHGIYTNEVQIDQGSTHIRSSKAVTESNEQNQLIKAIIIGSQENQAHFWTLTDPNKPELHAYANTIYYYPVKHLIKLVGKARIVQGEESFSAAQIKYDVLHHHVLSQGNSKDRISIIINPGKSHE